MAIITWPKLFYPPYGDALGTPPSALPFHPASSLIGPAQVSPVWPPFVLATALNPTGIGGSALAPKMPSQVAPNSTNTSQTWTPTATPATPTIAGTNNSLVSVPNAAPPGQSAFAVVDSVRAASNKLFGIVSNGPGTGQ